MGFWKWVGDRVLDARRRPTTHRVRSSPYVAGVNSRLTSDWPTQSWSANKEAEAALTVLRARSRWLANNSEYAAAFLRLCEMHIIGKAGIRLQANALENDGRTRDDHANKQIEDAWARWCRRGVCSIDGQLSLKSLLKLVVRSVARDGEVLVRPVTGAAAGNEFMFGLQLLEGDQLDEKLMRSTPGQNRIVMGVEKTAAGKPVAYHILTQHPGDLQTLSGQSRIVVPASELLHIYRPERVGQSRGIPWMASAMSKLNMLNGYQDAEVTAARIGASKMGFYKQGENAAAMGHDDKQGESDAPIDEAEPGMFEKLPHGWEFESFDPDHPTTAFDAFVKSCLRGFASGTGVSYHGISNDLTGANYSSLRQGALDERDSWGCAQDWLIEFVCQPLYEQWLAWAIRSRQVSLPLAKFEKFAHPIWHARGWQWVDPQKEVEAYAQAISLSLKSRTEILAEQGRDFEEVAKQLAKERDTLKLLGLPIEAHPGARPHGKQTQDDKDPEADAVG